jgi:hypothetical protein
MKNTDEDIRPETSFYDADFTWDRAMRCPQDGSFAIQFRRRNISVNVKRMNHTKHTDPPVTTNHTMTFLTPAQNISSWAIGPNHTNVTRCVQPCFEPSAYCGTLPCFTTMTMTNQLGLDLDRDKGAVPADERLDDDARSCEVYRPHQILHCYCKPELESVVLKYGVFKGAQILWTELLPCQAYLSDYLTAKAMLIIASLTVISVNMLLKGTFDR